MLSLIRRIDKDKLIIKRIDVIIKKIKYFLNKLLILWKGKIKNTDINYDKKVKAVRKQINSVLTKSNIYSCFESFSFFLKLSFSVI